LTQTALPKLFQRHHVAGNAAAIEDMKRMVLENHAVANDATPYVGYRLS
jgi:hypothetical protein